MGFVDVDHRKSPMHTFADCSPKAFASQPKTWRMWYLTLNKHWRFRIGKLFPGLAPASLSWVVIMLRISNVGSYLSPLKVEGIRTPCLYLARACSPGETWAIGNMILPDFGPRVCWTGVSYNRPWRQINLATQDSQMMSPGIQCCH